MTKRLGRYEIVRRIASGGMATVHLGRVEGEGGFERLFAIKVMHPHLVEDPEFVSMFLDEARLAASIRHPNVVSTYDVRRSPGGMFIAMDYVDGPSLARIIRILAGHQWQMSLGIALRILLDLLAGLEAAHALVSADGVHQNLVHRDVSPANVLVGSDGISRITDFGVARAEARITTTRGAQVKGKLPYVAPEQLSSVPIDRRVDVYAAGCVLWEMLTLQRLFRGDGEAELIAAVLAGPRQSLSEVRPDVPWAVDRACMQALETVDRRHVGAAAFADALEQAAASEGVVISSTRDVSAFVRGLLPGQSARPSDPTWARATAGETPAPGLGIGTPSTGPTRPSVPGAGAPTTGPARPSSPGPFTPSDPLSFPSRAETPAIASTGGAAGAPTDATPHTDAALVAPRKAVVPVSWAAAALVIAVGTTVVGMLVVWLSRSPETVPPNAPEPAATRSAPERRTAAPAHSSASQQASATLETTSTAAAVSPSTTQPTGPGPTTPPEPTTPRPQPTPTEYRPSHP